MSVKFQWVRALPSSIPGREFDVQWLAESSSHSKLFFNVFFGEGPSGPWVPHFSVPVSLNHALGVGHSIYFPGRNAFIRVRAYSQGLEVEGVEDYNEHNQDLEPDDPLAGDWTDAPFLAESPPIDPGHAISRRDWLQWAEMKRREHVALKEIAGFPGFFLRRRRLAPPCPVCSDEILGDSQASNSQCRSCYGTGYTGGYHLPAKTLIDWTTRPQPGSPAKSPITGSQEIQEPFDIKTSIFPSESIEGDLFVDAGTGNRYHVIASKPVLFKIWPIAQMVKMRFISKTDVVYRFPIPNLYV